MEAAQRRLVEENLDLARIVAITEGRRLVFAEFDELIAIANEGLVRAANAWDGRIPFTVYARVKIKYHLIDTARHINGRHFQHIPLVLRDDEIPEESYENDDLVIMLKAADMPSRWKFILYLKFWLHMTQTDIGKILGIHESRVSQIVSKALPRLDAYN